MLRIVFISRYDASLVPSPERYFKLVFDILKVRKAVAVLFIIFLVLIELCSVGLNRKYHWKCLLTLPVKAIGNLSVVHCWEVEVKACLHISSCLQAGEFRRANSVLLSVIGSQDTWVAVQGDNVSFLLSYCQINLPWTLLQWYSKVQDALLYNLVKCLY